MKYRPLWQYGSGKHKSEVRRIIGSLFLTAMSDSGNPIRMRHLIVEGSSQWVIGRNVTKSCDILQIDTNVLKLPVVDSDMNSFIPYESFCTRRTNGLLYTDRSAIFCAAGMLHSSTRSLSCSDTKKIVDKIHRHVCGHSSYSDIKILLERDGIWNETVAKYLAGTIDSCSACRATALPKPTRKVSLSSMSREFNSLVCIDHFYLDELCVFHVMDSVTRYSVGSCMPDTTMYSSILAFESGWMSEFWTPNSVLYDPAFKNEEFQSWIAGYEISARPIPPRRHNKNALESKHRIIRDIYLRMKSASTEGMDNKVLFQQAVRVSNDLYGNDVIYAFELAKGFTRPLLRGKSPLEIPRNSEGQTKNGAHTQVKGHY